jgi:hypothetical protein
MAYLLNPPLPLLGCYFVLNWLQKTYWSRQLEGSLKETWELDEDQLDAEDPEEEEREIIADDVLEEIPEPQDDDKDEELAVEDDANTKGNEEVASHPEPSSRHKELYGRYLWGKEGRMCREHGSLRSVLPFVLDNLFSVCCGGVPALKKRKKRGW